MSLQHPIARVRGLGSAKSGSQHWWLQRVTALALLLLSPWFVVLVLSLLGSDQAAMRAALAQPMNATFMLAFVIALCWHARLGLQVVIEDYIHIPWLEWTLQLSVLLAYALTVLASVVALGRIVFSA